MYIDRIIFPVQTLGPGNRLVIWTAGCSKRCAGCANPELWSVVGKRSFEADEICHIVENIAGEQKIDGITVSGGDPLEQAAETVALLERLTAVTEDILLYTGYSIGELELVLEDALLERLKSCTAVLIDGRYIDELNAPDAVLRGSSNQNIIYFKDGYRESYETYLAEGRKIQNVYMGNKLISVGIHNRKGV